MESQPSSHQQMPTSDTLVGDGLRTFDPFNGKRFTTHSTADYSLNFDTNTQRITIPTREEYPSRTLVCCFDGTGDSFDSDNSNIVELFSMLKKDEREKQMVYYQTGLGTTTPKSITPLLQGLTKVLDAAIAFTLDSHVMAGYEFLMQNYVAGDKICLFGFSRGAYTARALAGMLHKVGLLPPCNHQQVPFAYKMFTSTDEFGWKQSTEFKRAFSIDVRIEFLGVWDTVNSVGIIPHRLPFTTSNTVVKTFRHALALDERRAKFKANLWNRPTVKETKLDAQFTPAPPSTDVSSGFFDAVAASLPPGEGQNESSGDRTIAKARRSGSSKGTLRAYEQQFGAKHHEPTDIEEVWFAGAHSDVGGGSVPNGTPHSLARIALRWMIRECFKCKTGILFDAQRMATAGIDPGSIYPVVLPRSPPLSPAQMKVQTVKDVSAAHHHDANDVHSGTEEEEDLRDALCPIYDQLSLSWWKWFILELYPVQHRYQRSDDTWVKTHSMNLGGPRFIPKQKKQGVKVHRSVKTRMEAGYMPAALFTVEPTWVD